MSSTQKERREGVGGQVDVRGVAEATGRAVAERRTQESGAAFKLFAALALPMCI